ncbi:hypothetical protein, partial [Permianibacter aggregans]|uniref:hypothetical protein n=1 Tax=Permianibacter aggregans TaxID=1510150 RepID=UPI001B86BB56
QKIRGAALATPNKPLRAAHKFKAPGFAGGYLLESGCKIVVSTDSRAYPYFTKPEWFGGAKKVPKIYCDKSAARAKEILANRNVAELCKPCVKPNKAERVLLARI